MRLEQDDIKALLQSRPDGAGDHPCNAPFRGMQVTSMGKISACGFNRDYLLGVYPKQNLHDIWFGKKAQKFREALSHADFSHGCAKCFQLIRSRNFANLPGKDYDLVPQNPQGYPTKINFELSNTCNLECKMCNGIYSSSIRQNREMLKPLPNPYGPEFLEELDEFLPHVANSHFLGGEPFLIPTYLDLWEKMIRVTPSVEISVQTNGTIYNKRVERILENLAFTIAVSIDSLKKVTFESIRKNARFETVMENLDKFIAHCHGNGRGLSISWCLMPDNWMELPTLIDFCNQKGITVFFNTVVYPPGFAVKYLAASQLNSIISFLEGYIPPTDSHIEQLNATSYEQQIETVKYWLSLTLQKKNWEMGENDFQDYDTMEAAMDEFLQEKNEEEPFDIVARKKSIWEGIEMVRQKAMIDGLLEYCDNCLLSLPLHITNEYLGAEDKSTLWPRVKSALLKAKERELT